MKGNYMSISIDDILERATLLGKLKGAFDTRTSIAKVIEANMDAALSNTITAKDAFILILNTMSSNASEEIAMHKAMMANSKENV